MRNKWCDNVGHYTVNELGSAGEEWEKRAVER